MPGTKPRYRLRPLSPADDISVGAVAGRLLQKPDAPEVCEDGVTGALRKVDEGLHISASLAVDQALQPALLTAYVLAS